MLFRSGRIELGSRLTSLRYPMRQRRVRASCRTYRFEGCCVSIDDTGLLYGDALYDELCRSSPHALLTYVFSVPRYRRV